MFSAASLFDLQCSLRSATSSLLAFDMPASLGKTDLKNVPTTAELELARKVLREAGPRGVKSKMQSMSQWLRQFPDSEVEADRRRYLEAFVCHQLKSKNGIAKATHSDSRHHTEDKGVKSKWQCKAELDKLVGEKKSEAWRNSGKLAVRGCRVTGSMEEDLKEWFAPVDDFELVLDSDKTGFAVDNVSDAVDGDLALLKDMRSIGSSSDGVEQTPPDIKLEKLTQKEIDDKAYQGFCSSVTDQLRLFQEMQCENSVLLSQLQSVKYAQELIADVKKHAVRIGGMVRLLLRAQTERVDKNGYKKLEGP